MERKTYRELVERIALARHAMWCHEATHSRQCMGPRHGDLAVGFAVALELYGPEPPE